MTVIGVFHAIIMVRSVLDFCELRHYHGIKLTYDKLAAYIHIHIHNHIQITIDIYNNYWLCFCGLRHSHILHLLPPTSPSHLPTDGRMEGRTDGRGKYFTTIATHLTLPLAHGQADGGTDGGRTDGRTRNVLHLLPS